MAGKIRYLALQLLFLFFPSVVSELRWEGCVEASGDAYLLNKFNKKELNDSLEMCHKTFHLWMEK